MKTNTFPVLVK